MPKDRAECAQPHTTSRFTKLVAASRKKTVENPVQQDQRWPERSCDRSTKQRDSPRCLRQTTEATHVSGPDTLDFYLSGNTISNNNPTLGELMMGNAPGS